MSLASNLISLVTRIGTEFKTVYAKIGDTTSLTTTAKGSLVAALNEVNAKPTGSGGTSGPAINDTTASSTSVYSSSKTDSQIAAQVQGLLNGAPSQYDTLKEISDYIATDQSFATATTAALGNRVRHDTAAQGLTSTQQANARTNIGAAASADLGDPTTNFVTAFETALAS